MPLPKSSAARLSPSIILVNSKLRVPLCRHLRQLANPQRGRASFALGSVEGRLLTQRSPVDSFKSVAAITVASTSERTGEFKPRRDIPTHWREITRNWIASSAKHRAQFTLSGAHSRAMSKIINFLVAVWASTFAITVGHVALSFFDASVRNVSPDRRRHLRPDLRRDLRHSAARAARKAAKIQMTRS